MIDSIASHYHNQFINQVALGIIIQAHMQSDSLSGKPMQIVAARPLLDHLLERLDGLLSEAVVVVATTLEPHNDMIQGFCEERHIQCFRAAAADSLALIQSCAEHFSFEHVVVLSADNPFVDVLEVDRLLSLHLENGFDYSSSLASLPQGVGAQIFSLATLRTCSTLGLSAAERSDLGQYIQAHAAEFFMGELEVVGSKNRPDISLSIQTVEDLRCAQFIANHASSPWPDTEEVIALCKKAKLEMNIGF